MAPLAHHVAIVVAAISGIYALAMELLVIGTVLVGAVVALHKFFTSEDKKTARLLRGIDRTRIGDFEEGARGKIVGRVRFSHKRLISPRRQRPCVYYRTRDEELKRSENDERWVARKEEFEAVDFIVEDETGRAHVSTTHTNAAIDYDAGFWDIVTTPRLFTPRGQETRTLEGVLEEGEVVCVKGTGSWDWDAEGVVDPTGYRGDPKKRRLLRITGTEKNPVYVSDKTEIVGEELRKKLLPPPSDDDDDGDDDVDPFDDRTLCYDGSCLGIIDPTGKCGECGMERRADVVADSE